MKMIVITSVREDLQVVTGILEQSGVPVFSVSEIIGHKSEHQDYLTHNWFGRKGGDTEALVFFSFTADDQAQQALHLVNEWNAAAERQFPLRGFIMPVEASSH
ncbi:MAG TPA: hypothetical protein VF145_10165 [Chitinophagaceae bacterium]